MVNENGWLDRGPCGRYCGRRGERRQMHCHASQSGEETGITAVASGHVTHDREPETGARRLRTQLVEALEHRFLLAGRYTRTLVAHLYGDEAGTVTGSDCRHDGAAAMNQRIVQEVADHVAQIIAAAAHLDG